MYTYIRAVGVYSSGPKGQQLLDISKYSLETVCKYFKEMIVVLNDSMSKEKELALNLFDYYEEVKVYKKNIQSWLDENQTRVLKTSTKVPGNRYGYVTSQDIQYKWFSLFPGSINRPSDSQGLLTVNNAPDIRVMKTDGSKVDYKALANRSLWTINGYMVRAVADDTAVYLQNAGKHYRVYDGIHVNCLNFNTISTLNTETVVKENIKFIEVSGYQQVRVKSKTSLKGKTVWMSIGGQLYFNDIVDVLNDNTIRIQTDKVDWFTKIFDAKRFIDISTIIDKEREIVDKNFFRTEDFFQKLFTDLSTFIIILDNGNMSVESVPLTTYRYPFTYHTEEKLNLPLMLSNGMIPKYFVRKIINRRLLDIDMGVQRAYLNKTTGSANEGNLLHDYTNRCIPSHYFRGYHLKIRSIVQKD